MDFVFIAIDIDCPAQHNCEKNLTLNLLMMARKQKAFMIDGNHIYRCIRKFPFIGKMLKGCEK